jgi:O-antigen/teichoic acid export membrane protein
MHYKNESAGYHQQLKKSLPATKIDVKHLFWQIFKEAVPFVYLGSGITLGQLIDQFTFKQIMNFSTSFSAIKIQNLYTLFSANPNKITNVIISFSMAVGATTLPMLAGALGQKEKVAVIIQDNLRLLFALLTPVTIILALLAARINTVFYSYDLHGNWLLFWAILMTFILSIFSDVCTMIQSLGNHRLAVILLSTTLILKLVIQYPLVFLLRDYGALLATALAFGITTWVGLRYLKGFAPDTSVKSFADISLITRANLVFIIFASALFFLLNLIGISYGRLGSLLFSIIYGIPAALIYIGVAYWYNLPQIVLKLKSKSNYKHF